MTNGTPERSEMDKEVAKVVRYNETGRPYRLEVCGYEMEGGTSLAHSEFLAKKINEALAPIIEENATLRAKAALADEHAASLSNREALTIDEIVFMNDYRKIDAGKKEGQ